MKVNGMKPIVKNLRLENLKHSASQHLKNISLCNKKLFKFCCWNYLKPLIQKS